MEKQIALTNTLFVQQKRELFELVGFETRNKYQILDESNQVVGYCAEQGKGLLGFLFRQFLGHWRRFELHFFSPEKQVVLISKHPFRFFFQRIEVFDSKGQLIGAIQQRFGILTKKFDIEDARGQALFQMRSGLFSIWTFPITRGGREIAKISKKWGGILKEVFTDSDKFQVQLDPSMSAIEKHLVLVASVFVDLQYFERKAD